MQAETDYISPIVLKLNFQFIRDLFLLFLDYNNRQLSWSDFKHKLFV